MGYLQGSGSPLESRRRSGCAITQEALLRLRCHRQCLLHCASLGIQHAQSTGEARQDQDR